MSIFFYISGILTLLFLFITGFHDESSLIATIITSRSIRSRYAFILACVSQFFGTVLLGTNVARGMIYGLFHVPTVLVDPCGLEKAVCAGMAAAIFWNLLTWFLHIPSSSSHALVGGLLGAFFFHYQMSFLDVSGFLFSVLLPLLGSPIIGYGLGYLVYYIIRKLISRQGVHVKNILTSSQIFTCVGINAFQGSNDAQKGIGVIALLLMSRAQSKEFTVPIWVLFLSAFAIVLGLAFGGLRMIRSVGTRIYNVRALHSMCAQITSLGIIFASSTLGFPVSGTQIVNSSIMGVGTADRPNAVGWRYMKSILLAWLITIPVSGILSFFMAMILFAIRW